MGGRAPVGIWIREPFDKRLLRTRFDKDWAPGKIGNKGPSGRRLQNPDTIGGSALGGKGHGARYYLAAGRRRGRTSGRTGAGGPGKTGKEVPGTVRQGG